MTCSTYLQNDQHVDGANAPERVLPHRSSSGIANLHVALAKIHTSKPQGERHMELSICLPSEIGNLGSAYDPLRRSFGKPRPTRPTPNPRLFSLRHSDHFAQEPDRAYGWPRSVPRLWLSSATIASCCPSSAEASGFRNRADASASPQPLGLDSPDLVTVYPCT